MKKWKEKIFSFGKREKTWLKPFPTLVTLNNHFPNTLLSRIHVRGIMKADKHNTPPQTLSFLHLLPYKNGENGLITLLKTPISTTSTLHSQHFSLSLSLSLYMANLATLFTVLLSLLCYSQTGFGLVQWPGGTSTRFYDFKVHLYLFSVFFSCVNLTQFANEVLMVFRYKPWELPSSVTPRKLSQSMACFQVQ